MIRHICLLTGLLALAACSEKMDYQGLTAAEYSARYPKAAKVETRHDTHTVYFPSGSSTLSADAQASLREFASGISPLSAERILISMPAKHDARGRYLERQLRKLGFEKRMMGYAVSNEVAQGAARIDITYTHAVLPDCPDWRKSSTSNQSNTLHSQMRCAQVTNLGAMLANPRDLEYGSGSSVPNADRTSLVLEQYRTNLNFGVISSGESASGSSGGQ